MSERTDGKKTIQWRSSIQTRLVGMIVLVIALVLGVNLYIFRQVSVMVLKIDSVFASNVSIGELSDRLALTQTAIYEYLNTKSSAALENYYRYSEEYQELAEGLNDRNTDNPILMLEKDIRNMSLSYIAQAESTISAKRGRNVERYKASYEKGTRLYEYINSCIYRLNDQQFRKNSENYQFLLRVMRTLEAFSLAIIVLIVLFSLFAVIYTLRTTFRPLRELARAAYKVADGDLSVEAPQVRTQDEIGIVTGAFHQMLGSIRAYIERVKENVQTQARMKERELSMEANLKEAQLKFLQAQINPHFLFNSLNAGAQLAVLEDAEATSLFLEKMADFFRYNVKKMEGTATLGEEIELVDTYIYILNVRFAGDITYEKRIEEGVETVPVPGMLLQPLVENAVTHGIRDRMDQGVIQLLIEREESHLRITVSDNGAGMSTQQIRRVMDGEQAQGADGASTRIGLGNVINRLRLFYGREDLLTISSEGRGRGTKVTVFLPLAQESAEHAAASGG